eukprot:jgi/Botrbrau1/9891/Bobra.0080s0022.2
MKQLQRAFDLCSRFISICSDYGLVTKQLAAVANSLEEGSEPLDSATLRESKIARFKDEKALKASLLELQQKQIHRLRRRQILEDDGLADPQTDDEEGEREMWLTIIKMNVVKCVDLMASLRKELSLLEQVAELPQEERCMLERRKEQGSGPPPEVMSVLAAAAKNLERHTARSVVGSNIQGAHDVLRPSHNLPTITLAQQAEYELRMAAKSKSSVPKKSNSSEESDVDDEETLEKARQWDEFKDDNPRGWGNRKNQG